jgi:hypothetical protein
MLDMMKEMFHSLNQRRIIYNLTSEGNCENKWWDEKKKEWKVKLD